jgi:cellulose synthase/poly-beta-1,6-N-acetylglucosamine synthase-like glycosyltransferase
LGGVAAVGQSGSLLFSKSVFSLLLLLLFSFLLTAFFVAVGSDKIQKPSHFSVAAGLCFFQLQFFISYRRLQCFCLLVAVFGRQFGFLHFQQTVFKIIPGFAVFAFYCGCFRWTV